jgi:hypothetical protein
MRFPLLLACLIGCAPKVAPETAPEPEVEVAVVAAAPASDAVGSPEEVCQRFSEFTRAMMESAGQETASGVDETAALAECIESNTGFQADKPEEYARFARCVEAMGTSAEAEACSPASE